MSAAADDRDSDGGAAHLATVSPGPAGSVSPLDTYLVPRSLLEAADPAVERARQDEVERQVAACMADRGFTYLPVVGCAVPGGPPQSGPVGRDEPEPGTRAWAERWGYGIATAPPTGTTDDADRAPDPNHAIAAALDPERRRAYERALYGRALDDEPGTDGSSGDAAVAGLDAACRTRAVRAVYGWSASRAFPWPDGLDPWADKATIHDAALQDPRVVAALADWSRRMVQAGHPGFTDLDDPAAAVAERRARVAEHAAADPAGAAEAFDRLARAEVAVAVADWDARVESGVVTTIVAVRWEREREYVGRHRDVLEAYRATTDATTATAD